LRTQIRAWDGPAIISSEWFTMVDPELAARFVAELAPAEVHLVFTTRNLVGTVPAAWQERLKLGDVVGLREFVAGLDTTDNPRWNWGTIDPSLVLPRWEPVVPADRIHLVTVPPRGSAPDRLWRRFASACSLADDACVLDQAFANASLSAEGARLLQLMGPDLRAAVDADTVGGYLPYRWIRDYLSHRLLAKHPGSRIALLPDELAMLHDRSNQLVAGTRGLGYDIIGDLDDLLGGSTPSGARHPEDVSDGELLDLALALIPPMLGRIRTEREESLRRSTRIRDLQAKLDRAQPGPAASSTSGPSKSARQGRQTLAHRIGRRLPSAVRRRIPASIRARAGGTPS
jgi:hypothetical protein